MHTRCLEGMGSVVLEDVSVGLAWVGFAAVVGFMLTAAAAYLLQRRAEHDEAHSDEMELGYNALAVVVDKQS
ncbi:MAG: hypothetical protein NW206_04795 [Hyphomonadaceae bacterium]|nr:hypothetical protein [Hyphomonadaceae bacterium]